MAIVTPFELTEPFSTDTFNSRIGEINANLGKYNLYWWKRRTFERAFVLGEEKNEIVGAKANKATSYTISYSSDITVDLENKTVSLAEPISTVSVSYDNKANANVLAGKYFISNYDSGIYYATPGATATVNYSDNYYYVYILAKSCIVGDIIGNFEFLQSPNRNEYPDSGVQDGYEYYYIGVPSDNVLTASKIVTGSYIGTGTFGSDNPTILTADFEIKLVIVQRQKQTTNNTYCRVIAIPGMTQVNNGGSANNNDYVATVDFSFNRFSMYSTNASGQMNASNATYVYTIIG